MKEDRLQLIESMQSEGLQQCREMLYKCISDLKLPTEYLGIMESLVEDAYRIGIETEADIVISLTNL